MQSSSWQPVRQYDFDIDTGLYSDASVCPTSCTDTSGWAVETGYRKLRLKSVQLVGYDTTRFPNNTTPIKTLFTYQSVRDDNKIPRGGWNRLEEINNGQTGTLRFAYANIADTYPLQSALFANRHRVTSKTVNDGRGNAYTWSYSYGMAAMNSLGTANGDKGPNQYPTRLRCSTGTKTANHSTSWR